MLSPTDIQYITGYLFVVARRTDICVVLGEKVRDEASETYRDVDIVIVRAGETGFVAAEVKDESRRLDVIVVEALCMKFADMPDIRERFIVSTSGYTEPARRKAAAHGAKCLTLRRGALPSFPTIDLSHVKETTAYYLEWVEGPNVELLLPLSKMTLAQRQEAQSLTPNPRDLECEQRPADS